MHTVGTSHLQLDCDPKYIIWAGIYLPLNINERLQIDRCKLRKPNQRKSGGGGDSESVGDDRNSDGSATESENDQVFPQSIEGRNAKTQRPKTTNRPTT